MLMCPTQRTLGAPNAGGSLFCHSFGTIVRCGTLYPDFTTSRNALMHNKPTQLDRIEHVVNQVLSNQGVLAIGEINIMTQLDDLNAGIADLNTSVGEETSVLTSLEANQDAIFAMLQDALATAPSLSAAITAVAAIKDAVKANTAAAAANLVKNTPAASIPVV